MTYRLLSNHLGREVRRAAREQIEAALEALAETSSPEGGVHETRRRLKRVRALLRIARDPLGEVCGEENRRFRDVGRALAGLRDDHVALQTFDRLFPHPRSHPVHLLEEVLAADLGQAAAEREPLDEKRPRLVRELEEGRRAVACWPLSRFEGFDDLETGLERTYRRARRARGRAGDSRDPREFHEWRKRVKYHREHVRLLQETWRRPLRGRRKSLSRLSGLLGEAHDVFMLRLRLTEASDGRAGPAPPEESLARLDHRRRHLERRALLLGRRLFVEKPKRLVGRLRVCWQAWLDESTAGQDGVRGQ